MENLNDFLLENSAHARYI